MQRISALPASSSWPGRAHSRTLVYRRTLVYGLLVAAMFAAVVGIAFAAGPAIAAPRFLVGRPAVASALNAQGFGVHAEQVSLLANTSSSVAYPVLAVRAFTPWGGERTRVEIACRSGAECLPFYVLVTWPDPAAASAAAAAFAASEAGSGAAHRTSQAPPIALKAGAHATLTIDGAGMIIRVPVVCLENGVVGRKIRVRSEDRKQVYIAEVLDGGSLRGEL